MHESSQRYNSLADGNPWRGGGGDIQPAVFSVVTFSCFHSRLQVPEHVPCGDCASNDSSDARVTSGLVSLVMRTESTQTEPNLESSETNAQRGSSHTL